MSKENIDSLTKAWNDFEYNRKNKVEIDKMIIKFLEECHNEETNKFDVKCKCGIVHSLNSKQVFVIIMHNLACKKCGNVIIPNRLDDERIKQEEKIT